AVDIDGHSASRHRRPRRRCCAERVRRGACFQTPANKRTRPSNIESGTVLLLQRHVRSSDLRVVSPRRDMIVCFSKSYETSHFDALAGGAIEALASWRQHAGGATGMTLT